MKTTQSTLRGRSMFRAERIPQPFQNNGTIQTWPGEKIVKISLALKRGHTFAFKIKKATWWFKNRDII
jgi:hypothetical protein